VTGFLLLMLLYFKTLICRLLTIWDQDEVPQLQTGGRWYTIKYLWYF